MNRKAIACLLASSAAQAAASASPAERCSQVVVAPQPPQSIRSISVRPAAAEGMKAVLVPIAGGKACVPADVPLPWRVDLDGFETGLYTAMDARGARPIVLRRLATLAGRLDRPGKRSSHNERFTWFLKRGDASEVRRVDFEVPGDGGFEVSLPAGIYQGVVLGESLASRIRSGIVLRPGERTGLEPVECLPTTAVSFRVRDAKTHVPVSGALVKWDPPDERNSSIARLLLSNPWSASTDEQGTVSLRSVGPLPIPVRWRVEAKGYSPTHSATVLIREDGKAAVPVVDLRGEAMIVVRASWDKRTSLPPAVVVLQEPDPGNELRFIPKARETLRSGEITFPGVAFGRKRLLVETTAGRPLRYADFTISEETTVLDLVFRPITIRGVVTRAGKPAENFKVLLADPHDSRVSLAEAMTGPDGAYSFETYQTGSLFVYTISWRGPGADSGSRDARVDISDDRSEYEVDFDIPSAGLRLYVYDSTTSLPIGGARVDRRLELSDGHLVQGVSLTGSDGRLVMSDYAEGTARLNVQARGFQSRDLVLPIRDDNEETGIALDPARGVVGRVLGPSGLPIAGARVSGGYPGEFSRQAIFEAVTDDMGRFQFESAPPSGTSFYVAAPGHALAVTTLTLGEENVVAVSPPSPGLVYVVSSKGPPLTNHRIVAAPVGGRIIPLGAVDDEAEVNGMQEFQLMRTGRDGALVLPEFLAPGAYELFVAVEGGKPFIYRRLGRVSLPVAETEILVYKSE